nr:helix-turn-helix transcriptional regulator [Pseudanabaena sp. PCC 6802]
MKLRLKEVREEKGLSQFELAQLTEMSPQNIQKLEQSRSKGIQFDTLERLCTALEVDIKDLLVLVPR